MLCNRAVIFIMRIKWCKPTKEIKKWHLGFMFRTSRAWQWAWHRTMVFSLVVGCLAKLQENKIKWSRAESLTTAAFINCKKYKLVGEMHVQAIHFLFHSLSMNVVPNSQFKLSGWTWTRVRSTDTRNDLHYLLYIGLFYYSIFSMWDATCVAFVGVVCPWSFT